MIMNPKPDTSKDTTSHCIAMSILQDAKKFKQNCKGKRSCDYHDYERFKQELLLNDCYGYEKQLADILGV
jgi:hypothetical protein